MILSLFSRTMSGVPLANGGAGRRISWHESVTTAHLSLTHAHHRIIRGSSQVTARNHTGWCSMRVSGALVLLLVSLGVRQVIYHSAVRLLSLFPPSLPVVGLFSPLFFCFFRSLFTQSSHLSSGLLRFVGMWLAIYHSAVRQLSLFYPIAPCCWPFLSTFLPPLLNLDLS